MILRNNTINNTESFNTSIHTSFLNTQKLVLNVRFKDFWYIKINLNQIWYDKFNLKEFD